MDKSENFNKIKEYYDNKLWDKNRIYKVVDKRHGITREEYQEITNEIYR